MTDKPPAPTTAPDPAPAGKDGEKGGKTVTKAAGYAAAIGIGSAALVAALLYARRDN